MLATSADDGRILHRTHAEAAGTERRGDADAAG
jgi:hypothetical protein